MKSELQRVPGKTGKLEEAEEKRMNLNVLLGVVQNWLPQALSQQFWS